MKIIAKLFVVGVAVFVALQFVRPAIPAQSATAEIQAPPEIKRILEKDCYSCHSDERRLAWFDEIVPAYWLVRHDILTAREHLNFSRIGGAPMAAQKGRLFEAATMIQLGAMPLPKFVALHPDAKVTPDELAVLKSYLAPWGSPPERATAGPASTSQEKDTKAVPVSLAAVQPEFNGLPFDGDFENWKMVSITDRGDNNTFRFILGNEAAIKAAGTGQISPWPDGTRFAKIAWEQELGADGLVRPGKFVQVELMVKDAQRYKDFDGWGWGRWRGLDLKPYGSDARFVNECTGCHLPVRGDDYVYTLPITAAKFSEGEVVNNNAAAMPSSLPYQPLSWNAITMYVDPATRTMATLYGNAAAMQAVRQRAESPAYSAGSVLALITWAQRDDPHWFGARIPDKPESVEFVEVGAPGSQISYRRFAGESLAEEHPTDGDQRAKFIQSLCPARLP
jgi:hypothetical protein